MTFSLLFIRNTVHDVWNARFVEKINCFTWGSICMVDIPLISYIQLPWQCYSSLHLILWKKNAPTNCLVVIFKQVWFRILLKITQNQKREKNVLSIGTKIKYFCPQICVSAVKDPGFFSQYIYFFESRIPNCFHKFHFQALQDMN